MMFKYVRITTTVRADSHMACRAHGVPLPCHAMPLRVWNLSFPPDLHSAAVSDSHLPCHAHAMLWPCHSLQGHGTARPSLDGLEKNGMVTAWHGDGTASVNQTWAHCANQMGKTHSKPLAAWHGRGTACCVWIGPYWSMYQGDDKDIWIQP